MLRGVILQHNIKLRKTKKTLRINDQLKVFFYRTVTQMSGLFFLVLLLGRTDVALNII